VHSSVGMLGEEGKAADKVITPSPTPPPPLLLRGSERLGPYVMTKIGDGYCDCFCGYRLYLQQRGCSGIYLAWFPASFSLCKIPHARRRRSSEQEPDSS
jgi:hypothetical protein